MFLQPTESACQRSGKYVSTCQCRDVQTVRAGTMFPECAKCGHPVLWRDVGRRRVLSAKEMPENRSWGCPR